MPRPDGLYRAGLVLCAGLFLSVATIGLTAPWRLVHEDTGVTATALATAHLKLGLGVTKGHDFWFDQQTGAIVPYAHHPPGSNLLLAGVFAVLGARPPAAARGLSLVFHALSLVLIVRYLRGSYGPAEALLGGFVVALIPMSTFFGRLVAPEPFVLPAMLVFVLSYFKLASVPDASAWVWGLVASAVWGAFMGWPMFFAMLACLGHALTHWVRTRSVRSLRLGALIATLGVLFFVVDVAHIHWAAGPDGLHRLATGFAGATTGPNRYGAWQIALKVLGNLRRYYTDAVFVSAAVCLFVMAGSAVRRRSVRVQDHVLLVLFTMGVLNVLLFPDRARNHHYWTYYLLPFMVVAFVDTYARVRARYTRAMTPALVVVLLLIAISSAQTLHLRHTRPSSYTVKTLVRLANFF